jgi:hypothetical protein
VRVRAAHRDYWSSEPRTEEWLLIEWPKQEAEPTKYWLSTLPASTNLSDLVRLTKQRWIIERDYQELKQELGLGHYEGRGWRGFHHHATLCIAAYGFLVAKRSRFSPSARAGQVDLPVPEMPLKFRPRGSPGTRGVQFTSTPGQSHRNKISQRGGYVKGDLTFIKALHVSIPASRLAEFAQDKEVAYILPNVGPEVTFVIWRILGLAAEWVDDETQGQSQSIP